MQHILKSEPHQFEPTRLGLKLHDLRRNDDRNFAVGDTVVLREFLPDQQRYTGREVEATITYITSAQNHCVLSPEALHPSYCVLSLDVFRIQD
ncbi:MAG: DUF3850 domain-containing protein [Alphaproteobacteria bacterium]